MGETEELDTKTGFLEGLHRGIGIGTMWSWVCTPLGLFVMLEGRRPVQATQNFRAFRMVLEA